MSSWFARSLSSVSDSVQQLADQAELQKNFEKVRGSVQNLAEQAELDKLGQQIVASTQGLQKQGEAALRTHGLLQAEEKEEEQPISTDAASIQQLAKRFAGEANTVFGEAKLQADSMHIVHEVMKRWLKRLSWEGSPGTAATEALLQSRAVATMLVSLPKSKIGRTLIRSASTCDGSAAPVPGEDVASAKVLRAIMARVSKASPILLGSLLKLVADAGDLNAKQRKMNSQTAQDSGNQIVPENAAQLAAEDLQWALSLISLSVVDAGEAVVHRQKGRAKNVEQALATIAKARPHMDGVASSAVPAALGANVWAEWPGDGRWYQAQVKSMDNASVEVEWLKAPEDIHWSLAGEYLAGAFGDSAQFKQLSKAAVAPAGGERPAPAASIGEEAWLKQLDLADALSKSFRDLRGITENPQALQQQSQQSAGSTLTNVTESLCKLRSQKEQKMETLGGGRSTQAEAEHAIPPEHLETKLKELGQQQEASNSRITELDRSRSELLDQLQKVDRELAEARSKSQELSQQELQLRAGGRGPTTDSAVGSRRQQFSIEADVALNGVEDLLKERLRDLQALDAAHASLAGNSASMATACAEAEALRRRQCEDVTAGLHAELWAHSSDALVQDAERLAAIRSVVVRAGGLMEYAWRETVQIAAESLDGGMSLAAKRYKEMRGELEKNLDRIGKFEAAAAVKPAGFKPPARPSSSPLADGPSLLDAHH